MLSACHETVFTAQLATLDQHTMLPCWLLLLLLSAVRITDGYAASLDFNAPPIYGTTRGALNK